MLVLRTGPKKPKHPEMALKSETMGSYGRNAGEHRVRLLPNRAASPRAPTVFRPKLSVRGRDPHDCSDASYVGGCNDGRSGFRTDRPRLRVRGDRGPVAAHRLMVPTVMAKTYNRASLRLSVTIIGLRRVRLKVAPVSAAPMSMLRTQVRPIAPGAGWAARPPTAVLAYLACMGTDLGL